MSQKYFILWSKENAKINVRKRDVLVLTVDGILQVEKKKKDS